jgi:hypothetical protein
VTRPKRTPLPGRSDRDQLLARIKRLVQQVGDDDAPAAAPQAQRRELERLKSELAESVRRDLTKDDDGIETT